MASNSIPNGNGRRLVIKKDSRESSLYNITFKKGLVLETEDLTSVVDLLSNKLFR